MTRPKDAHKRRSLNMPITSEGLKDGQPRSGEQTQQQQQPPDRSTHRQVRNGSQAKIASNGGVSELEPGSSRSGSPNAPVSTLSEQSKSPVSPSSPTFNALPQYPPSPERAKGNQTRSFFQNLKASRSASKIPREDPSIRPVQQEVPPSEETPKGPQRMKSTPEMREAASPGPVPDMPRLDDSSQGSYSTSSGYSHAIPRRPVGSFASQQSGHTQGQRSQNMAGGSETMSQASTSAPDISESRKSGGRLLTSFMRRNQHARPEEHTQSRSKDRSRSRPNEPSGDVKPRSRDQSATRSDMEDPIDRPSSKSHHMKADGGAGSQLFREFKQTAGRAAKGAAKEIGKSKGRFFRSRNSSNTQPPPDFSNYKLQVINQKLEKQTRDTRIAKRLEDSKDKTEFWMPALPWRCIDYLNFNGAEVEGLYRVPGSEREVRMWKARFDQEGDIDLFQEEELYDVNTIGSLFKSWLRDLPEPIFSESIQDELTQKYQGEPKAPEELKNILSELPPWNYYLLFAITCHLSLLHAYEEKNKMSFNNLYICFAPALRLNGDCFRWLVGDWRSCWIGCSTEKEALEEEYRRLQYDDPDVMPEPNPPFIQETYYSNSRKGSSAGQSVDETPRAEAFGSPRPHGSSHSHNPKMQQGNGQPPASTHKTQGRRKAGESPHSREASRSGTGRDQMPAPGTAVTDSPHQQPVQDFNFSQPQPPQKQHQQQQQLSHSPQPLQPQVSPQVKQQPQPSPQVKQQSYQQQSSSTSAKQPQPQQQQQHQQKQPSQQPQYQSPQPVPQQVQPKQMQQPQQQQRPQMHQREDSQKLPELDLPRPMSSDWMNK